MRAKALGYQALALTDECSVAGMVRAHVAAQREQLKILVGSQFQVQGDTPFTLIVLACNLNEGQPGYPSSTLWAARIGGFPCKINHLRVIF